MNDRDLKKRVRNLEDEIVNIKANYLLMFIVGFIYLFLRDTGEYTIFGYIIPDTGLIIGLSAIAVLFFIKDIVRYSKMIIRKTITGGKL